MEPVVNAVTGTDMNMLRAVGAGLAAIGMLGSGIGLGVAFGKYFEAVARQPAMESSLRTYLFIGMALIEAIALFAFVIAIMALNA